MHITLKENETMQDLVDRLADSFRLVYGIAPVAYWYENLYENGRIKDIHFSRRMREMLGYSSIEQFPDELSTLMNFTHPDDIHIMLDDAIAAGTGKIDKYDVQYRLRKADGSYLWCNATGELVKDHTGKTVGMYGAFINVNEEVELQKKQEEGIRLQELTNGFARQCEAAFIGNLKDHSFRILSDKEKIAESFAGASSMAELVSRYTEEYVHPFDKPKFDPELFEPETAKHRLEVGTPYHFDYRSSSNGGSQWYRATFSRISEDEVLIGFQNCDQEVLAAIVDDKLMGEFDAIYYVDLDGNTIRPARSSRVSKVGAFQNTKNYSETLKKFAETVEPKYKGDWISFADPAYMKSYMAGEDHREYVYELPETSRKMRRFTVDVIERNGSGEASTVLFSFMGIDDARAEKIRLNRQLAEKQIEALKSARIIAALSEDFSCVDYIELFENKFDDSVKEFRVSEKLLEAIPDWESENSFSKRLDLIIERLVYEPDKQSFYEATRREKILTMLEQADFYFINTRFLLDNELKYYQIQVSAVREKNKITGFVIGLHSIDEQVRASEEQRRKLEEALSEARLANQRSEALHEAIKSGPWSFIVEADNQTVTVNFSDELKRLIHYDLSPDPYSWTERVHPEDREHAGQAFWAALFDPECKTPYDDTYRFLGDDGVYRWFNSAGKKIRLEDGRCEIFGMFVDVSDQMEKEREQKEELRQALAMAQSASKAKTTFLNNMSHDIRTPMNAIIGYTGLAASHIDNRDQVRDYLSKISQSSDHLLSLINDVLDMSRIESGKMNLDEKPENLPDIIHTLRDIVQHDIHAKKLDFFVDAVDVNDEEIVCDKLRLNQVLLNIVSNAIKYTGAGGTIALRVIEKNVRPNGYAAFEFRVKDNGMGMDKEFLEHIFDPFTRMNSSTVSGIQGSGLGMAITKNIVDMMGGRIEIESEPGKGTEVVIDFDFALQSAPKEPVEIPELKGVRALVVDDDINTCISVANMLRDIGMRDEWCASGREAVIRAEEACKRGDLFKTYVIDWLMPDMNGIETTRRIRKVIGDDSPIIILTTYDWSDIEDEAREAGVTAFISKPMFPSDLQRVLNTCLGKINKPAPEEIGYNFNGKKILLVEDNELNREIARELLQEYGFIIDEAEDGTIAVEKMQTAQPGDYDLILMDIQMPHMDGHEATRRIRALGTEIADIPIIAMTANAFEEDRKAALDAGMDDHIAKPIDLELLKEMLARYIG